MQTPTLRIAVPALPDSIDPATLLDSTARMSLAGNAYAPFAGPHSRGAIWEAIESDADFSTFAVRILLGVRSANGELLAADDVVWSWSRAFALGGPLERAVRVAGLDGFESVQYVNRQTVQFRLRQPNRAFEQYLLGGVVPLIDSKTARRQATTRDVWASEWLSMHSAGFGAYNVDAFKPGRSLDLNAIPGSGVVFDEVIVEAIAEAAERSGSVAAGRFDVAIVESAADSALFDGLTHHVVVPAVPGTEAVGTTLLAVCREGLVGFQGSQIAVISLAALMATEHAATDDAEG